jgi:hypothetical protein
MLTQGQKEIAEKRSLSKLHLKIHFLLYIKYTASDQSLNVVERKTDLYIEHHTKRLHALSG